MEYDPRLANQLKAADLQRMRADAEELSKLSSSAAAEKLNRRCSYCGELLIPRLETFMQPVRRWPSRRRQKETNDPEFEYIEKTTWVFPKRCGCSQEAFALAGEEHREAIVQEERERLRLERLYSRAGLVGRLLECTFASFLPRPSCHQADDWKERVMAYCKALLEEETRGESWLVLHGDFGLGKTHLMVSVLRTMIEVGWGGVYFRSWPVFLRRIEATFDPNYRNAENPISRAQIIEELASGRLVGLDDLDKRRPTAFTLDMIYEPLNTRYLERLPTILCFNSNPSSGEAEAFIGPAIVDRMLESAFDVIEFRGSSFRLG